MKNIETKNIQSHSRNTVLCDGFLIPMTDFVLKIDEFLPQDLGQFFDSWRMSQLRLIKNYAKFLKQPLKLEMFVPCDEEGDILEEPTNYEKRLLNMMTEYNDEVYTYYQAKEKVLFEGFKPYEDYECTKYEDVYVDEEVCDGKFTIEELIKDVGKTKIKLSQTALNAIFRTVA